MTSNEDGEHVAGDDLVEADPTHEADDRHPVAGRRGMPQSDLAPDRSDREIPQVRVAGDPGGVSPLRLPVPPTGVDVATGGPAPATDAVHPLPDHVPIVMAPGDGRLACAARDVTLDGAAAVVGNVRPVGATRVVVACHRRGRAPTVVEPGHPVARD